MFQCRHKPKILKCKECSGMFCAGCIQLEVHQCPKLDARLKTERANLESKLVKVIASKVQKF